MVGGGLAMCHALGILMVGSICRGGGVGGASGEGCCRELLEEGGYMWCGRCVGEY